LTIASLTSYYQTAPVLGPQDRDVPKEGVHQVTLPEIGKVALGEQGHKNESTEGGKSK